VNAGDKDMHLAAAELTLSYIRKCRRARQDRDWLLFHGTVPLHVTKCSVSYIRYCKTRDWTRRWHNDGCFLKYSRNYMNRNRAWLRTDWLYNFLCNRNNIKQHCFHLQQIYKPRRKTQKTDNDGWIYKEPELKYTQTKVILMPGRMFFMYAGHFLQA
jgi:hypothetical protein